MIVLILYSSNPHPPFKSICVLWCLVLYWRDRIYWLPLLPYCLFLYYLLLPSPPSFRIRLCFHVSCFLYWRALIYVSSLPSYCLFKCSSHPYPPFKSVCVLLFLVLFWQTRIYVLLLLSYRWRYNYVCVKVVDNM